MIIDPDDDGGANSRRYTQDGINVVALDRRGLRRARPERRFPSGPHLPVQAPRSMATTVVVVVLLLAAVALVLART